MLSYRVQVSSCTTLDTKLTTMNYMWIYCVGLAVLCISCVDDSPNFIDPELQPYVDQFFEEAEIRDLDISADDFSFSVNFGEKTHLGVCSLASNEVLINSFHWSNFTELEREYLMFHELGHCILDRLHDDQSLPNGECKSIMNSAGECRENLDNYNIWRTYYMDELFDPGVDVPEWYKTEIQVVEKEVLVDIRDSIEDRISIDLGMIQQDLNIKFEAYFEEWDKSKRATLTWGDMKIGCTNSSIYISDSANDLRYLKKNAVINTNTKITFIRKDGFDHYLVDDRLIHLEEQRDNTLQYVRVALETLGTDIYEVAMSLKVALVE